MKLVIVESPSKAKTIKKYLGGNYVVRASIGHIRDLPKSNKDAIDIENGYVPNYEISAGKNKVVKELIVEAKKADEVVLASDPDREGEAIAWHLETILKKAGVSAPISRVAFNEVTETAIKEAMKRPRKVDNNLRKAQEARRVLDRLMGYDLSGLIWQKVRYGLSAGRVQSPALRILMEREREIRAFIPESFFVLTAGFLTEKSLPSLSLVLECEVQPTSEVETNRIKAIAEAGTWQVLDIKESETKRHPKPPFTTSTLQQTASTRLGFSPSRTMQTAQKLYEAGHITYMRTDSPSLSKQAQAMISQIIKKEYSPSMLEPRHYASKSKNAQEAHEAIRPTSPQRHPKGLVGDQARLYELIWTRAVASQMASAKVFKTKLTANVIDKKEPIPDFYANGSRIVYLGWLELDRGSRSEDVELPLLKVGDLLKLKEFIITPKETQPPNRYSEAGLIKELEKRGIGRPSTYASIIRTLEDRGYVTKEGRTLLPTDTGDVVSSFLEKNFAEYISDDFTAEMEDALDDVATGESTYLKTITNYYEPLKKAVSSKKDLPKVTNLGEADKKYRCPLCQSSMVIKLGKTGKFLSCSKYPDCEGALTIDGQEVGTDSEPLGLDPASGLPVYLLSGRFGYYVQLGKTPDKKDKKTPKPKRASLPAKLKPENLDLKKALHLLALPRELGNHPIDGFPVIANTGRFGPYVGHRREFRSLKGDDSPYDISLDRALELLSQPKALPKGVELVKSLGFHPKTGKEVRILKSKTGFYLPKKMKRIYLDEEQVDALDLEKAIAIIEAS